MANFPGLVLTDAGRKLQAKAQIGAALTFSRVALGDGDSTTPEEMATLANEKLSLSIQDFEVVGDGTSRIRVIMTNESLSSGFFVRELGVFAEDPDTGEEKLYSYTNAGEQPDFLPAGGGATLVENVFDLYTVVGNAQNVTAQINDYITIATKQDIDEIRPLLMPAGGTTGQLARKVSNGDGDVEWFDPAEGTSIAVDSLEERRVAVADQRTFRLATVTTRGMAVYLNGQRLSRSEWQPLGETQMRFSDALAAGDEVIFVRNEEAGEIEIPRVSLTGPDLVYPGSSNTYTITDYDSFAEYAVTASRGTVTRSGDTITLDIDAGAPAGGLDLNVTRGSAGVTYPVAVGEQTIAPPEMTSPANNDTGVALRPTLQLTPFRTYPSGADTQASADYQVAQDDAFTDIVWQTMGDTQNLEAITPGEPLPINTKLYGRGRQHGTALGSTEWTPTVTFTTTNTAAQPVITSPAAGATGVAFSDGITITASAFNFPGGGDDHTASDWELRHATTKEIIASTTNDGANLTTWTVGGNSIPALAELEVRNRYKGQQTGYTPWAEWSGFTTAEPSGEAIFTEVGNHQWLVPAGVTSVSVVAIGGGGSHGKSGGTSSFSDKISAHGGNGRSGGGGVGGTGGDGGKGGAEEDGLGKAAGGGGAGGYSGNGGRGNTSSRTERASAGQGGAGGGGGRGSGGGGVGLQGEGESGKAGSNYSGGGGSPGKGGSGGTDGGYGGGNYGGGGGAKSTKSGGGGGGLRFINGVAVTPLTQVPIVVGDGSDAVVNSWSGAPGAVRIIWGPGRSFPDNAQ